MMTDFDKDEDEFGCETVVRNLPNFDGLDDTVASAIVVTTSYAVRVDSCCAPCDSNAHVSDAPVGSEGVSPIATLTVASASDDIASASDGPVLPPAMRCAASDAAMNGCTDDAPIDDTTL